MVLRERGDLDKAIADCDRAIEIQPDLASAWRERSYDSRNAGDLQGALADAERAVEHLPLDHGDAFDRVRVTQCFEHGLVLVSSDAVFDDHGIDRTW